MTIDETKAAAMIEAVADTIGQARATVKDIGLSPDQTVIYCEAIARQAAAHVRAIYQLTPKRSRRRKADPPA
jgi:ABC-type Na+ transport system ATPase subunit NatA